MNGIRPNTRNTKKTSAPLSLLQKIQIRQNATCLNETRGHTKTNTNTTIIYYKKTNNCHFPTGIYVPLNSPFRSGPK